MLPVSRRVALLVIASGFALRLEIAGQQRSGTELTTARKLIADGSVDKAIVVLRAQIQNQPANVELHRLLATSLALASQRSASIEECRVLVGLAPRSAEAHNTCGVILAKFEELDAAQEEFEQALAHNNRLAPAHIQLALLKARQRELVTAKSHLTTACQLLGQARDAAYAHRLLAQVLKQEGKEKQSQREYEQAIRLDPMDEQSFYGLGEILIEERQYRKAIPLLRNAIRLRPDFGEAWALLGKSFSDSGDLPQAVSALRTAHDLLPEDQTIAYHLMQALRKSGDTSNAARIARDFERAKLLNEEQEAHSVEATALNNSGVELEMQGQLERALEKYRAAVAINPKSFRFKRNIALVLYRLGNYKAALVELEALHAADANDAVTLKYLYLVRERTAAR